MHPIEIQNTLDSMTILVDTREHPTAAYFERLVQMRRPNKRVMLLSGDYSAECVMPNGETVSFMDKIAIERKMSANEISSNFTHGRERFVREFERYKAGGGMIFILIEKSDWGKIRRHEYDTQFNPASFIASLMTWQARYNAHIVFCSPDDTGFLIERILYYQVKELLERGDYDNYC